MICPTCAEPAPSGATWCEACGSDLSADGARRCESCGEEEVSSDDYCMACGHKQPSERDHQVFLDGQVDAASDRGKRHHHNEDAVAIGALERGGAVAVVCDGVSSTPGSAVASIGAAIAARNVLVSGLSHGPAAGSEHGGIGALLVEAAQAAQDSATKAPPGKRRTKADTAGPPSATFVACVVLPSENGTVDVYTGWLGDSRAYWIDGSDSALLTSDHAIDGSLTRWIGADAPNPTPETVHHSFVAGGRLVVCSDGLWRYAETAAEMAALLTRLSPSETGIAERLAQFANESGGHDNISVAVWPVGSDE